MKASLLMVEIMCGMGCFSRNAGNQSVLELRRKRCDRDLRGRDQQL